MRGASAAGDTSRGRTDQTGEGEHGSGAGLVPGDPRTGDLNAEHALRVSLKRGGLVTHDVPSSARQVDECTQLGGNDTRN